MINLNGGRFICAKVNGTDLGAGTITKIDGTTNSSSIAVGNTVKFNTYRMGESGSSGGVWLKAGSGNTAPTINDYDLANPYTDVDVTSTGSLNDANGKITVTGTLLNQTGQEITINEIGVFFHMYVSSSISYNCMIARVLVPTRTVGAGESATFTYEIDVCK